MRRWTDSPLLDGRRVHNLGLCAHFAPTREELLAGQAGKSETPTGRRTGRGVRVGRQVGA
jgi:hypothetical protein